MYLKDAIPPVRPGVAAELPRPTASSANVALRMSQQRSRDTAIEFAIRRILHARGYRYRIHVRPVPGLR